MVARGSQEGQVKGEKKRKICETEGARVRKRKEGGRVKGTKRGKEGTINHASQCQAKWKEDYR